MTTAPQLAAAIARDLRPEPGGGFSLYVPGHPLARQQFATREEGEAECLARAESAIASMERDARLAAKEAARQSEFDAAFDPYGETLSPLARGKAKAHLSRSVMFRDVPHTWLAVVQTLANEGRFVERVGTEWRLVAPGGSWLVVSKTAADYASFLKGGQP